MMSTKKVIQTIAILISLASGLTAFLPNPENTEAHEAILLAHKLLDLLALNIGNNSRVDNTQAPTVEEYKNMEGKNNASED